MWNFPAGNRHAGSGLAEFPNSKSQEEARPTAKPPKRDPRLRAGRNRCRWQRLGAGRRRGGLAGSRREMMGWKRPHDCHSEMDHHATAAPPSER